MKWWSSECGEFAEFSVMFGSGVIKHQFSNVIIVKINSATNDTIFQLL